MLGHVPDDRLLDLIEGTNEAAALSHVERCERCRERPKCRIMITTGFGDQRLSDMQPKAQPANPLMLGKSPRGVEPTLCLLEQSGIDRCPALRNQDPHRRKDSRLDAGHPEPERIWQRRRI